MYAIAADRPRSSVRQSKNAWRVIDSVAVPGPPFVRMFGRSTILNASIMRIRIDRRAHREDRRDRDVAERPASGSRRRRWAASRTSWSWPSSAASRTMNMNGVHCQMSPIITASRASHGSFTQREVLQTECLEHRQEWSLARVGQHLEDVCDADGRDHHRQQEDDPEEPSARHSERREDRETKAESVLDDEPDEDIGQRHEQRPRPAARAERRCDKQPGEPDGEQSADRAKNEAQRPDATTDRSPEGAAEQQHRGSEDRPAERRRCPQDPDEMALLQAEEQALEVDEPDEPDVDAALAVNWSATTTGRARRSAGRSRASGRRAGPARGRRCAGRGCWRGRSDAARRSRPGRRTEARSRGRHRASGVRARTS